MSQSNLYLYGVGMFLGGTAVTTLGGIAEYLKEKQMPKVKSLVRDFIIGAIMVAFVLQLVPDSVSTLLTYLPTSFPTLPSLTGGSLNVEPDLQVGPVNF